MSPIRVTSFAAALLALVAMPSAAQEACRIDYGRPNQIRDARNLVVTTELGGKPAEEQRQAYARAVMLLTRDENRLAGNMLARNAVLGHALINLALLPDMPREVARGEVGYATSPEAMVDLMLAADSALDAVEAENPACKEETEGPRRKAYAELVNNAVNAYNARQIDEAELLSERAAMIYDGFPMAYIAYQVLGNVRQTKNDLPGAVEAFKRMAELATDTSAAEDRKTAITVVSELLSQQADALEGDARNAKIAEQIAFLEQYSRELPDDVGLQAALAMAQLKAGNTDAAQRLFNDMSTNPDKYSEIQIMEAGVTAARAEQNEFAAPLFEAVLRKNPWSRDALFNLAAVYDAAEQHDKMPTVLEKLIAVDPENPDNYQLWARYWQARAQALRPAAEGKEPPDSAYMAWQDANNKLLEAFTRMQEAPVRVSFSLFSHDGPNHVLAGNIENRTDEQKNYTLKFEFLDANGGVLDSRDVSVDSVAGKSSKSFRVEITEKPGIVAFRYAPLP